MTKPADYVPMFDLSVLAKCSTDVLSLAGITCSFRQACLIVLQKHAPAGSAIRSLLD